MLKLRTWLGLGLYEEGIRQAKEASEISERIGDKQVGWSNLAGCCIATINWHGEGHSSFRASPRNCNVLQLAQSTVLDSFRHGETICQSNPVLLTFNAVNNYDTYVLTHAVKLQAGLWYRKNRFEEAKSEASRAVDAFENLGVVKDAECGRDLLLMIDRETRADGMSDSLDDDGEALETMSVANPY